MLGGQPNHGRQLSFPLLLHDGWQGFRRFQIKDLSIDEMVGA